MRERAWCAGWVRLVLLLLLGSSEAARAGWIWVEGEAPAVNKMNRHPWWYDQVKKEQFSGGDFISNFDRDKPGEAEYRFQVSDAGEYEFWVRANPLMSKLSYALNGGPATEIDLNREKRGEVNVAADGKPDLRFLAWSKAGKVTLKPGENRILFRMTSQNSNHGYLDCFVFSNEPFQPRGLLKPDQLAAESQGAAVEQKGWLAFDPKPDNFAEGSAIDLRWLNEKIAGENGFIEVKDGQFVHSATGEPVRFWAVNGPPHDLKGAELKACARMLAKHGVNLVRIHGGYFNRDGEVDIEKVKHALEMVAAMKAEGIYAHLSIYFPLWLTPKPGTAWLQGYDGKTHPFAALLFNPDFQTQYRKWWTALLTTMDPVTGKTLAQEPAVAGLEIQNEDSFFFWTFSENNIPDAQLRILEKQFGDWLAAKHGSLAKVLSDWGQKVKRDAPEEGRVGFRPLWNMSNEKSRRDQETVAFLLELQTRFYRETYTFLRKLGFKGAINASNWTTASPEVLTPLEKLSYASCDFIDRHGYFGCNHKGEAAEWSVRNGHTYSDRSGLRFDAEQPGKPKQFVHPAMDPHYAGKPSMISETTWNRPNRFRSEAPLYFAVYGALQHSDAIVHFALDGKDWAVKPGFWMQPWTLMSPAMMGQFPAAALIYRKGLVSSGAVLAEVDLQKASLLRLEGTPLPQDAALDELRLKDLPTGLERKAGSRIDPLIHYAGRTEVRFVEGAGSVKVGDLSRFIDHSAQMVTSSTGELRLDYGKGVLMINAVAAQGVSGVLKTVGRAETKDLVIDSEMELGHIVAVALDGKPLAQSDRILLQVMSEEKSTEFSTEPAGEGMKRITNIGVDPWMIRELKGTVRFKRTDAARLRVTALDLNGYPERMVGDAEQVTLQPGTVYYLVTR